MVKSAFMPKPTILPDQNSKSSPDPGNGPIPLDREAFHYHLGMIVQNRAALKVRQKELKVSRRAAQDAGINLGDLDHILKIREDEPETVQEGIRRLAKYAEWAGLAPGVQGDLFDYGSKTATGAVRAEDEGFVDGLEGVTAQGERYDVTTPEGQARLKGWNRGQQILRDRFVKPLDKTVQ